MVKACKPTVETSNTVEGFPVFDGDDSNPENKFLIYYIHNMNESLSLWTNDAEDFMYKIKLEMCLSKEFEALSFPKQVNLRRKWQDIN